MTEYVERGYILNELAKVSLSPSEAVEYAGKVYEIINSAPAADVAPAVWCGECDNRDKNTESYNAVYCRCLGKHMNKNGYCCYGKKET